MMMTMMNISMQQKKDLLQWVYGRVGSEVLISTGWHAVARGDGVVNPSY